MRRKIRGMSLLEVVMAATILSMVAIAAAQLLSAGMSSFNKTNSESDATHDVTIALQYLTRDLQEAKEVTLVYQYYIRIYYPQKINGKYDRMTLDPTNYIEYYRGDPAGNPKSGGVYFIRKRAGEASQKIGFNVTQCIFKVPSPGSIDVSLGVQTKDGSTFNMLHRAIFMRNY